MGGKADFSEATNVTRQLEQETYDISYPALKSGLEYAQGLYGQGGMDQSGKYGLMQTDVMEGANQRPTTLGTLGTNASVRALGASGVGSQRVLSGLDEMNKIRGMLGSHGLQTTNFGQEAGAENIRALSLMPRTSPWVSAGLGAAAAGTSIYGGIRARNAYNRAQLGMGLSGGTPPVGEYSNWNVAQGTAPGWWQGGEGTGLGGGG